jgi:phenylacetic acid degradation operon negative regulatory protein
MANTRTILFSIYADYLGIFYRSSEKEIGIGSIIKLLSNFSISEPSVRITVSRMCKEGLLKSRRKGLKSYYSLTDYGLRLVSKSANRLFQIKGSGWNGTWSIVVYSIPEKRRPARDKLRAMLKFYGYVPLSDSAWISPTDSFSEIEDFVNELKINDYVQIYDAQHRGFTDPKKLIERSWDLKKINAQYEKFIKMFRPILDDYRNRIQNGNLPESSKCFVDTSHLVRKYRDLPFMDPGLPVEIIGKDWLRSRADTLFRELHSLLFERAKEYFQSVLDEY